MIDRTLCIRVDPKVPPRGLQRMCVMTEEQRQEQPFERQHITLHLTFHCVEDLFAEASPLAFGVMLRLRDVGPQTSAELDEWAHLLPVNPVLEKLRSLALIEPAEDNKIRVVYRKIEVHL